MYQIIGVDDWSHLDLIEVLNVMSVGSLIYLSDPSPACTQQWSEPISEARN